LLTLHNENGWRGNQYTTTKLVGKLARVGSGLMLGIGTGLDLLDWAYSDPGDASQMAAIRGGTNFAVGLWGFLVPPAAIPAAGYFLFNAFYPGGVVGAMTDRGAITMQMMQYDPTANVIF
jgi:hypothetical protein